MNVLKARLKKGSKNYINGLNPQNKPIWLQITDFNPIGENNYQLEAIKEVKNGMPIFFKIWVPNSEVQIKSFDDGQMKFEFTE